MSGLIDWLLGLSGLSVSDAGGYLTWDHAWPAWVWAGVLLLSLAVAGWSYSRLEGLRWVRVALALLRGGMLLLIVMLLAGPRWVTPGERSEPYRVLVLVDRSASLTHADVPGPGGAMQSREAALREAFAAMSAEAWSGDAVAGREVEWLGFGEGLRPATAWLQGDAADQPDESVTAMRSSIDAALAQASGQPVASVVVFSDGRTAEPMREAWMQQLRQQGVSVFVVPLGAAEPQPDLAVVGVDGPTAAFVGDLATVAVTVDVLTLPEAIDPSEVKVRLVNVNTDEVVDEVTHEGTAWGDPVTLQAESEEAGSAELRAEVVWEGQTEAGVGETATANNSMPLSIAWDNAALRVIYLEGIPRWEYRYLANFLVRETSLDGSVLLAANPEPGFSAFIAEGDTLLENPPIDAEQWREVDVVVIGDLHPSKLPSDWLEALKRQVAEAGVGLVLLGGEDSMPVAYAETPAAAMLPMFRPEEVTALSSPAVGWPVLPTDAARSLALLTLTGPDVKEDAAIADWPDILSPLWWVQGLGPLKPAATVLAETVLDTSQRPGAESSAAYEGGPVVVTMPYGRGRCVYVASDELWRWRQGRGEVYHENVWLQLIRYAGAPRAQQSAFRRGQLKIEPRRATAGEASLVTLVLRDPALIESGYAQVRVEVVDEQGEVVDTLELRRVGGPGDLSEGASEVVYRGSWTPISTGDYAVRVAEDEVEALATLGVEQAASVDPAGNELRLTAADHDVLQTLADTTGGRVLPLNRLERLGAELEAAGVPRAVVTPQDESESLRHAPLALVLGLVLLTLEWVGRKAIRLV